MQLKIDKICKMFKYFCLGALLGKKKGQKRPNEVAFLGVPTAR